MKLADSLHAALLFLASFVGTLDSYDVDAQQDPDHKGWFRLYSQGKETRLRFAAKKVRKGWRFVVQVDFGSGIRRGTVIENTEWVELADSPHPISRGHAKRCALLFCQNLLAILARTNEDGLLFY